MTSAKQIVDAVIHREKYKLEYEKAWKKEIEKHEKHLLRANKRKATKTNHYGKGYQPAKQKRKNKSTGVKQVKLEPKSQDQDSAIDTEISAISAEFVDFVFMI